MLNDFRFIKILKEKNLLSYHTSMYEDLNTEVSVHYYILDVAPL